jgi:hypothetical protein
MLSPERLTAFSNDELLNELRLRAEQRRRIDAECAQLAGEINTRSAQELGYSGLAQSKGARTAEILVQQMTGLSRVEAAAVVRVGSRPAFLHTVKPEDVGVAKVDAVRRGLGEVSEGVSEDALRSAAERLAVDAPYLNVEGLAARARAARDELDAANVGDREHQQREQRYFTLTARADGMYWGRGLFEPESAMVLKAAFDGIIAPRRGGPRFVDKERAAQQEKLSAEDTRTVPQMMVDALVDLVQVAVQTPEGAVLTGGKGQVTIHTLGQADGTVGAGYFEGHLDAASQEIVERYLCSTDSTTVGFEHGIPVDSSTDQRLFNRRQRRVLAARWGGCAFPDCDRPPSWTEAHHIRPWAFGNHKTETIDGVLLCRHHHMLIHNNGWMIVRVGIDYSLHAPDGTITFLESKSPLYRRHCGGAPRPGPPGTRAARPTRTLTTSQR